MKVAKITLTSLTVDVWRRLCHGSYKAHIYISADTFFNWLPTIDPSNPAFKVYVLEPLFWNIHLLCLPLNVYHKCFINLCDV